MPALSNQPSERLLHLYLLDLCGVSASASAAPLSVAVVSVSDVSVALDPFPFLCILCVLLITRCLPLLPLEYSEVSITKSVAFLFGIKFLYLYRYLEIVVFFRAHCTFRGFLHFRAAASLSFGWLQSRQQLRRA